jgi:hypothetical protein
MAFNRAQKDLTAAGLVEVVDEYAWVVEPTAH